MFMAASGEEFVMRRRAATRMDDGYAGNGGSKNKPGTQDELRKPHEKNLKLQYGIGKPLFLFIL
jgi:hypothetical protein